MLFPAPAAFIQSGDRRPMRAPLAHWRQTGMNDEKRTFNTLTADSERAGGSTRARVRVRIPHTYTVEFFAALILILTLACVAGVLYFYMMFLEARGRHDARRIAELERENATLREALRRGDAVGEQAAETEAESWPDVLAEEEGGGYSMK